MRFLILILFYVGVLILAIQPNLNIVVEKNSFYYNHEPLVDNVVSVFEQHCRPKEDIILKLKFDYIPDQVVAITPNQEGLTSIFRTESFVEVNPYSFESMSEERQKNLLLHEVGHAIGLKHVDIEGDVMHQHVQEKVDYKKFFDTIKNHCKPLEDVPREIDFVSKN